MNIDAITAQTEALVTKAQEMKFSVNRNSVEYAAQGSCILCEEGRIEMSVPQTKYYAKQLNLPIQFVEMVILSHELGHGCLFRQKENHFNELFAWQQAKKIMITHRQWKEWVIGFNQLRRIGLDGHFEDYEEDLNDPQFSSREQAYCTYCHYEWLEWSVWFVAD